MNVNGLLKKGVVISFGVFDGVHIGHQALISRMQQRANELNTETVIVTFDPHPALSTSGEAPPSITTIEKKIELLKAIGVNRVIVEDFNEEFSHLSPEKFVYDILLGEFHAQEIVVGYDCAFGKDRAGDKWLLKKLGEKYGTEVEIIEPYNLNGDVVSSTRVRNAIQQGDLNLSNKLLGRLYSISGIVVPGKGIGKKIGYATANLQTQNEVLPPSGVYAVRVHIEDQPLDGVLNMGIQPTLGDGKFRIEVHILDFEGDLYGRYMEVIFVKKIRDERVFASPKELKEQIEKDEFIARDILNCHFE
jgi:riboflavin kinase/FMN adenylyltransferase